MRSFHCSRCPPLDMKEERPKNPFFRKQTSNKSLRYSSIHLYGRREGGAGPSESGTGSSPQRKGSSTENLGRSEGRCRPFSNVLSAQTKGAAPPRLRCRTLAKSRGCYFVEFEHMLVVDPGARVTFSQACGNKTGTWFCRPSIDRWFFFRMRVFLKSGSSPSTLSGPVLISAVGLGGGPGVATAAAAGGAGLRPVFCS